MKLEFREPGMFYHCGTRATPAYKIPGVVFINDEYVVSFELIVDRGGFHLALEKEGITKHVYDFFNEILKKRSEEMSGLTEGGRYTSLTCPIIAWWAIRKDKLHEILKDIEEKMNIEWRKAIEETLSRIQSFYEHKRK